jgi:hypothetical protein
LPAARPDRNAPPLPAHAPSLPRRTQIVDASSAHSGGAAADSAWDRDALAGAAAGWPRAGEDEEKDDEGPRFAGPEDDEAPGGRPALRAVALAAGGEPALDLGRVPASPINRSDSTVPLAAEMSAELSIASDAGLPLDGGGGGGGAAGDPALAAALEGPALDAARCRAGCAVPAPAAEPAAVQAHNRAAWDAAAAGGLVYAGVGVREAAAVAEVAHSPARTVEMTAGAAARLVASEGGDPAAPGAPSAPPLRVAAAPRGAGGLACRTGGGGGGEPPAGPAGGGAAGEPLLGVASPKSTAQAAMFGAGERWAGT